MKLIKTKLQTWLPSGMARRLTRWELVGTDANIKLGSFVGEPSVGNHALGMSDNRSAAFYELLYKSIFGDKYLSPAGRWLYLSGLVLR